MRILLKPMMPHLKWPIRAGVFLAHLMHHTAAFFAWIWMLVQVIGTTAQAGLHASKIWEANVLSDLWRDGIGYFTANFARGEPYWCISIGFVAAGRPQFGVIRMPVLDETFEAMEGRGARRNGQPIRAVNAFFTSDALTELPRLARPKGCALTRRLETAPGCR